MVHAGFMRCWQAGGLNIKVLDHVKQLVQEFQQTQLQQEMKIYVTGNAAAPAYLPAFCAESWHRAVIMHSVVSEVICTTRQPGVFTYLVIAIALSLSSRMSMQNVLHQLEIHCLTCCTKHQLP